MKIAFFILTLVHGLLHVLGFVKAFGIKEVKELTIPLSQAMGILWLAASLLFLVYAFLQFKNVNYAWFIGFMAVLLSQILIVIFWKDAKFGTLPNLVILLVCLSQYGQYNFQKLVNGETRALLSRSAVSNEKFVTEKDIAALPLPVRTWLRHSGAVGKPYIAIAKVTQRAEMKLKPGQEHWYKATAIQYTLTEEPAFIWSVDVAMNSVINFRGRDKFIEGKGEMLIKLNALLTVVNEQGQQLNEGTMQRYLGEVVWFPSLALSPHISWQAVNDSTAVATMDYKGTKGSGTFYFNSEGDFIKYSAMRFKDNVPDAKRYEWVLMVEDYKTFEGIKVPSKMTATWKLGTDDWTWLKLEIENIAYYEHVIQSM